MTTDSTARDGQAAGGSDHAAEPMPPSYPPGPQKPAGQDEPRQRKGSWFREGLTVMVSAIVLSILIKTFLAQAFYIPSGSMENTLELGDRVMVSKLTPGPVDLERGDVVVFVDPGGWLDEVPEDDRAQWQRTAAEVLTWVGLLPQNAGHHLIKRVVGLPGDHVVCCTDDGRITVNGEPIEEEQYLHDGVKPSQVPFDVTVPEDRVWVMGDNRPNSADSRAHMGDPGGGTVPMDNIVGRAFVLLWPADRIRLLNNPQETFADVPESP
ncbi:hypothetical protein GCM10023169_18900 [Georgenia halophila]|uniref:Signal peptidase I n=1 Tax=Georgenia halophila TaxID=620889 RepID=A0ABP8L7T3_9MICO